MASQAKYRFAISLVLMLLAVASIDASSIFERVYCFMSEAIANVECCKSARVDFRFEEFQDTLKNKLYGQPRAAYFLAKAVKDHWDWNSKPRKALSILIQGPTGTGKTYITELIANHIYVKGEKSQYYHLFSSRILFPYESDHREYEEKLRRIIPQSVASCEKSIFVFDEFENMPVSVLNSLKPFLDYGSHVGSVDFRRSIFIFLSNIGSEIIVNNFTSWRQQHRDGRGNFPIELLNQETEVALTRPESGATANALFSYHLISRFILFLPLEFEDVKLCIRDSLARQKADGLFSDKAFINAVLRMISFKKEGDKLFAVAGCKSVSDKVEEAITAMEMEESRSFKDEF